jgi:tRNA(adenine34) deaminase
MCAEGTDGHHVWRNRAVDKAQRVLGRNDLTDCTIYSTVEPCAMCSFPIRETRISKVVFAIRSPLMGGFSKFGILQDAQMSDVMPEFFGDPPEIAGAVLLPEAEKVWRSCNPLVWTVIRYRGCFGGTAAADPCVYQQGAVRARRFNWRQVAHMIISKVPRRRVSCIEGPAFEGRPIPRAEQTPVADPSPGREID